MPETKPEVRPCLAPTTEEKAQWVKRFLESGISLRKFSAQHGLPLMSLWRWVDKARGGTTKQAGAVTVAALEFAEVQLPASLSQSAWVVELRLPNGTVMRMTRDVPSGLVEQLLRVC